MRLTALACLVALALPAAAQSQFSEEEGAFLTFDEFSLEHREADGWGAGGQVGVGWRFGNGADVALGGRFGSGGLGSDRLATTSWGLGLTGGYTLRPAPQTVARVQGRIGYQRSRGTFEETAEQSFLDYEMSLLDLDASATAGYDVPVVGTLRVRPTVGVYGQAHQLLTARSIGIEGSLREAGDWRSSLGLQVEAPVSFRLLGTEAALVPTLRQDVIGDLTARSGIRLGLRLNF